MKYLLDSIEKNEKFKKIRKSINWMKIYLK